MRAIRAMMAGSRGSSGPAYANGQAWDAQSPTTGICSVTFNTDGTVTMAGESTSGPTNWRTPTAGGAGNTVWVEVTKSSGFNPTTGTLNSRLQLSSARGYEMLVGAGQVKAGSFSVKFYDAASGGNLLGTNSMSLYAEQP